MTLGSLFDGIGGFPLAASRFGIKPIWASEIEPVPISITKKHFPDMEHLGDITKINGADITPVDLITFGSPCQDLSVAGKRTGLDGERSGLFLEAIRIIKEMREKTNGRNPARIIWENVPGAFSSNAGEDFRIVLQELAAIGAGGGTSIPRPSQKDGNIVWLNTGAVMGDGWSIAWRVLDAQYWGIPQRRRRIFLVADFTGQRATEILFKPDCVSGDFAESGAQGEETAGNIGGGVKTPVYCIATKQISLDIGENLSPTIMANDYKEPNAVICFKPGAASRVGGHVYDDNVSGTLRSNAGDNQLAVVTQYAVDFGRTADRIQMNPKKAVTLLGEGGGGGAKTGLYCLPVVLASSAENAEITENDISPTLMARAGTGGNQLPLVAYNTIDRHAVAVDCRNDNVSDVSGTLQAKSNGGQSLNYVNPVFNGYAVRRLTPLECERLMGFPDGWTEYGIQPEQYKKSLQRGKTRTGLSEKDLLQKITDSQRYKALGNSVAIPCVEFILRRILEVM